MAGNQQLGLQCSLSIGGATVLAMLRGSGGGFTYAARKLIAGSSASPLQGLIGYAVANGAKSALQVDCKVPYNGGGFLNGATTPSITVVLGFGSAGGITLATATLETMQVTGTEGGDIEATLGFQSIAFPTASGSTAVDSADYMKFNDVTSFVGPGISTADCSNFTFRLQRTLAAYRGNSPYGFPKYLEVADTECMLDLEYLKTSENALAAAIGVPLTVADANVILGANPLLSSGGTGTLTLTCLKAFHDPVPTVNGNLEDFVTEKSTLKASQGGFTIA